VQKKYFLKGANAMKEEVYMPKFGMTMTEGLITDWFKKEGDYVNKDEPLLEVETEKIVNSVDAPASGVLEKIMYAAGESIKIGTVIAVIDTEARHSN
jgi:pyruvate dehydrogenase E2 component (dihydrolipoamide acetyltransferase)